MLVESRIENACQMDVTRQNKVKWSDTHPDHKIRLHIMPGRGCRSHGSRSE